MIQRFEKIGEGRRRAFVKSTRNPCKTGIRWRGIDRFLPAGSNRRKCMEGGHDVSTGDDPDGGGGSFGERVGDGLGRDSRASTAGSEGGVGGHMVEFFRPERDCEAGRRKLNC